ncbi:MAG: right-handed parallel beta-helix repeat-containing protein [Deltaproteobacteria bacterium]|nr:right-handed parallel beta-helix repeat-containing protein [Deltaproteobacteria bacterium]
MKKIGAVLFFALFSMIFSSSGFAFLIGDVNNDNKIDLTEAINALQMTSGVRTALSGSVTINVPADVPTIQQAIDAAKSGDIINVAAGTYTGALTTNNKAVTIQGGGKTVTTLNGASGADILTIDGGKVVVVSGVTFQGGQNGILARRGAVVEVTDVVVQDATAKGIIIDENSTARLTNVTVQRCANRGIQAFRNSSISFYGTVASNNNLAADGTGDGIGILDSSSAYFSAATVTANGNGCRGITINNSSVLKSDGSSITVKNGGNCNNTGDGAGIHASKGSSIALQNGSSLLSDNNGFDGVRLGYNASFDLSGGSMTVSNNKRNGLNIWGGADAELAGTVVLSNNGRVGVNLTEGANLSIYGGTATIENNVDFGIRMRQATLSVGGTLTVSGTAGAGTGIDLNLSSLAVSGSLGVYGCITGIGIVNASHVTLYPQSTNTAVIQNNGIGIQAANGSGIIGSGSITIKDNTVKDIILIFGCQAALNTSYYGTLQCDASCLAAGATCPVP